MMVPHPNDGDYTKVVALVAKLKERNNGIEKSRELSLAITKLEEAMLWLEYHHFINGK